MLEFDIIRQIDGNKKEAHVLENCSTFIVWISVLFVVLALIYFTIATGGQQDPYIWNFLYTMQLLTHILLINVKIPGNAALFFNLMMPVFRFDYFTRAARWVVADWFNLPLSPSPIIVFLQQGNYGSTHMLLGTFFIYLCIFLLLLVMIAVPIMTLLSKNDQEGVGKWAKAIEERVFWTVPIQMIFLFYLVLAVLSWHNMLRPT